MQHAFNVEVATKYGINIAIFLNHLAFWVQHNMANERNFHDGHFWTYNSRKAYTTIFPYLTDKQIRTMIENCKNEGLILINNFNEHKYDQTCWYSLTEKACKLLNLIICPPGPMDLPSRANGFAPQGQPIPDINTDINTDKREPARKKRSPLSDSFQSGSKARALCKERGLDEAVMIQKFICKSKAAGSRYEDEQSAFELFILNEKNSHNGNNVVNISNKIPGEIKYESCSGCKRLINQCECALAAKETNVENVKKIKEMLKGIRK